MSVARCCCPKPGQPPPTPIVIVPDLAGYWLTEFATQVPEFGSSLFGFRVAAFTPVINQGIASGFCLFTDLANVAGISQGTPLAFARLYIKARNAIARWLTFWPPPEPLGVPLGQSFSRARVVAEDVDSATQSWATSNELNNAARTTAFTDESNFWDNVDNTAANLVTQYVSNDEFRIDVTAQAQAVVNRVGWDPVAGLQFFLDDNGSDGSTSWGAFSDYSNSDNPSFAGPMLEIAAA